jgi:hypothetical protein
MSLISACDQPHKYWYEYLWSSYYPLSPHNSKHLFDIYSFTHLFWLMLLTLIFKKIFSQQFCPQQCRLIVVALIIISTYFEIHENKQEQIVKYRRIEINSSGNTSYRGDSILNIIGDVIFNLIGIYLGIVLGEHSIIMILVGIFALIVKVVGFSYWTEFFRFLSKK